MAASAGARRRGCRRSSAGVCAFRGAKLALQPIVDAVHLVHGPIVCQGHSWEARPTGSTGSTLHRLSLTTDIGELDLIHGGDRKLAKALDEVVVQFDPPAVFVYQTCLPGMSGDDISATCKAAALRWQRPIIAIDAPGFVGDKLEGARIAGDILLDHVIGTREPSYSTAADVVLIGDYNVAGEVGHITALLASAGIRVVASIPGDGRFAEIASAHRACVAIGHCSQALGDLPASLGAKFDIPTLQASFYGARNVSSALRMVAAKLVERGSPSSLLEHTEAVIAAQEARLHQALAVLKPRLRGQRALLIAGGVKSWSLAESLRDFDMAVVGVSIHKTSERDRTELRRVLAPDAVLTDGLSSSLLDQSIVDIVLCGGGNRFDVAAAGIPWVEINHERKISLTGYQGVLNLATAIVTAFDHPLWAQVRSTAPW